MLSDTDSFVFSQTKLRRARIRLFIILFLITCLFITIPAAIFVWQGVQHKRQLPLQITFYPADISSALDETIPITAVIHPGENRVAMVDLVIFYDPAKVTINQNDIQPNPQIFSVQSDAPEFLPCDENRCRIRIHLSVSDYTKDAVSTIAPIVNFSFQPIQPFRKTIDTIGIDPETKVVILKNNKSEIEKVSPTIIPLTVTINTSRKTSLRN